MFLRALNRANLVAFRPMLGARQSTTAVAAEAEKDNLPSWIDGPERDLVNFPNRKQQLNPPPTRLGFIPQTWFDAFYSKTGVTGPYALGVGVVTFLVSKEIYVLEHEFYSGFFLFGTWAYAAKKFGPAVKDWQEKEINRQNKEYDDLRDININENEEAVKSALEEIESVKNEGALFVAKKENVGLQLEAAYRQRLVDVHTQVKQRLDYQLETSNVERNFEQKHMVNWIVSNVRSSITPAQEAATLKQCLVDLKGLAAKA